LLKDFHKTLVLICEETYSLALDATTFQYLIILVTKEGLHLYLMDDITTIKNDIYIKIPDGFNSSNKTKSKEDYSIKLNRSLY